jgi:hypothetical protein
LFRALYLRKYGITKEVRLKNKNKNISEKIKKESIGGDLERKFNLLKERNKDLFSTEFLEKKSKFENKKPEPNNEKNESSEKKVVFKSKYKSRGKVVSFEEEDRSVVVNKTQPVKTVEENISALTNDIIIDEVLKTKLSSFNSLSDPLSFNNVGEDFDEDELFEQNSFSNIDHEGNDEYEEIDITDDLDEEDLFSSSSSNSSSKPHLKQMKRIKISPYLGAALLKSKVSLARPASALAKAAELINIHSDLEDEERNKKRGNIIISSKTGSLVDLKTTSPGNSPTTTPVSSPRQTHLSVFTSSILKGNKDKEYENNKQIDVENHSFSLSSKKNPYSISNPINLESGYKDSDFQNKEIKQEINGIPFILPKNDNTLPLSNSAFSPSIDSSSYSNISTSRSDAVKVFQPNVSSNISSSSNVINNQLTSKDKTPLETKHTPIPFHSSVQVPLKPLQVRPSSPGRVSSLNISVAANPYSSPYISSNSSRISISSKQKPASSNVPSHDNNPPLDIFDIALIEATQEKKRPPSPSRSTSVTSGINIIGSNSDIIIPLTSKK